MSSEEPKKKVLSYSGYSKYVTCPKMYELHYNQRIRPERTTSVFVFGRAVDKALNALVSGSDHTKCLSEAQLELASLFKEEVDLTEADFDHEIISDETNLLMIEKLKAAGWEGTSPAALASGLFSRVTMGEKLTEAQSKYLRILVYFSFIEKVALILQAFSDYVSPQIEKVVSVQKYVHRGILDFEAKFKGVDGVFVCDNKTAGRDYDLDAVKGSVQLASYGAEKACYIVFNKTVRKNRTKTCSVCGKNGTGQRRKSCDALVNKVRCNGEWTETISPEIIPQVLMDDISPHVREMVSEAFIETEKAIEAKMFPRNLNACGKQFGKPCIYSDLCWNGSMKGLKKEE